MYGWRNNCRGWWGIVPSQPTRLDKWEEEVIYHAADGGEHALPHTSDLPSPYLPTASHRYQLLLAS